MALFNAGMRCFERVARGNTIRRAADMLNIAPSAVNRRILQLEHELGVPLFERLSRGLRLTAAGEVVLGYVLQWQNDQVRLRDELRSLKGARYGNVKLATAEALTYQVLPNALKEFGSHLPRIRIDIDVGDADFVLNAIVSGSAEIGVGFNLPESRHVTTAQRMAMRFGAIVLPDHAIANKSAVTLGDCMSYPLILPDQTLIARSVLAPALSGIGRELDVRARSNRIVTIKSLVCAGMGIGFLSELDVSAEMDARQVKFIPLRDQSLRPPILSVIIARRTKTSVASGILLEYLARELARFNPAPSS